MKAYTVYDYLDENPIVHLEWFGNSCCYNVGFMNGEPRRCSRRGVEEVGGLLFCRQHAKKVEARTADAAAYWEQRFARHPRPEGE